MNNILITPPAPAPEDLALEFEKRRNEPVKYDREVMASALMAIAPGPTL